MDKILILNGGYSEVPLIQAARAQGFYVLVTGNDEKAIGNVLADEYIPWDYSDREGIYELAKSQKVSAICSGCNDFGYLSAAYACDRLHLPGHDSYETAQTFHHKNLYRAFAEKVGIPIPRSVEYGAEADLEKVESLRFPVIVKPVDLSGGKGMRKCHGMEEVREAISHASAGSRVKQVMIEEFLEGTNHGFTTFIRNQKVVFSMLDREYHEYAPFAVSAASAPEPVPEATVGSLKGQIERMAESLQLCDGLVHTQFILMEKEEPVIIEACRRSPGDLYLDFVRHATGMDYPGMILSCEAGGKLDDEMACAQRAGMIGSVRGYWGRHVIACRREGKLQGIAIDEKLKPYIREQVYFFERGRRIGRDEIYKCGVLFLEFQRQGEMEFMMNHASEYITFEMEE